MIDFSCMAMEPRILRHGPRYDRPFLINEKEPIPRKAPNTDGIKVKITVIATGESKIVKSLSQAEKETGISDSTISRRLIARNNRTEKYIFDRA